MAQKYLILEAKDWEELLHAWMMTLEETPPFSNAYLA